VPRIKFSQNLKGIGHSPETTGITIAETGEPGKGAKFVMTVPAEGFRMKNEKHAEQMSA